jgi:hypothetical protein
MGVAVGRRGFADLRQQTGVSGFVAWRDVWTRMSTGGLPGIYHMLWISVLALVFGLLHGLSFGAEA